MIRLLESFGPYGDAQVPAVNKWSAGTAVTIIVDGGRSGMAGDNCAELVAGASVLFAPLVPEPNAEVYTATWGHAVQILSLTGQVTLGGIITAISRFELVLVDDGSLYVRQWSNGVELGVICETVAGVVPIGEGGTYLELQVRLQTALTSAVIIRARDQYGTMNPLVQGAILALAPADQPYTGLQLGGGVDDGIGTWRVADIYVTDSVPAPTALNYNGRIIYNDSFFGDTKVDALYATADGPGLTDPWVPNSGSIGYTQIDEHPPDEDVTYLSASAADQTSTFGFADPRQIALSTFGRVHCQPNPLPIYGVAWNGRLRTESDPGTVAPIVRRIVDGSLLNDIVSQGTPIVVDDVSYEYYPAYYDRDPTDDFAPFDFDAFLRTNGEEVGDVEFGIRSI